ncbi:MAG: UvrD-helicase domain-containing protein, partial [Clostridia bacterium]|nr:UvrD-helicase domain-containing protein [Clostridia bacterium]
MSDFDLRYSSIRKALIEREFSRLNDMQQKAVFKTEGPLLLLAGAGSGKTTVLINRIINLLRFGRAYESPYAPEWAGEEELRKLAHALNDSDSLDDPEVARLCAVEPPKPWEIIAITFTNKAAGELKERLEAACGAAANDIWAHTFHSACTRILRRDIERIGYSRSFTIYDEDDKKKLLNTILKDLGYDPKRYDVKGFIGEISRAKDSLMGPEVYAEEAGEDFYKKIVSRVYAEYQKRMMAANALDFDDIIFKTVELLEAFEEVRSYYQRKFRYVLVDEYQDTNYAQYVLCKILAGGYENLCVVGDDDQSIYKFRGATIANILEFEKQYPAAETIRLEQNYRSTSNILSA